MATNVEIVKAVNVFKNMCTEYYPNCIYCPMGFDVDQNGGNNCRLQYNIPKNYEAKNPNWKAIK